MRQNVGGELMGYFARPGLVYRPEVALAENLSIGHVGLADVEKPAIKNDLAILLRRISGSEEVGVDRRRSPVRECQTSHGSAWPGWLAEVFRALRHLEGIHPLGRHGEQTGALQVPEERVVKGAHEVLGGAGATEVGRGHDRHFAFLDYDFYLVLLRPKRCQECWKCK